jgi:hypothetical protein
MHGMGVGISPGRERAFCQFLDAAAAVNCADSVDDCAGMSHASSLSLYTAMRSLPG